jgi:hypothetical protein
MVLLSLAACGEGEPGSALSVTTAPWAPSIAEDAPAGLDPATVGPAIERVLRAARAWDAWPVLQAWDAAMVYAEPACPGFVPQGSAGGWVARCETSVGARFLGYGFLDAPPGGFARAWWGSAQVVGPAGQSWTFAGRAEVMQEPGFGLPAFSRVAGSFARPAGATDWLDEGVAVDMVVARVRDAQGTAMLELRGDAGAAGLAEGFDAVDLDLRLVRPGSGALLEPSGSVALRREDGGGWVTVTFTGPDDLDAAAAADGLDGCGVLDVDGAPPVCVDLSGLLEEAW